MLLRTQAHVIENTIRCFVTVHGVAIEWIQDFRLKKRLAVRCRCRTHEFVSCPNEPLGSGGVCI